MTNNTEYIEPPHVEAQHFAADEDVRSISKRLIAENLNAYKELSKAT